MKPHEWLEKYSREFSEKCVEKMRIYEQLKRVADKNEIIRDIETMTEEYRDQIKALDFAALVLAQAARDAKERGE